MWQKSQVIQKNYSLILNIFFYLMVHKITVLVKISGALNTDIITLSKALLCTGQ